MTRQVVFLVAVVALGGAVRAEDEPITLTPPEGVIVHAAAFTPDGKGVVAVGWKKDGSESGVYCWGLKSGKCEMVCPYATIRWGDVTHLRWSPDGKRLLLLDQSRSSAAAYWIDAKTWKLVGELSPQKYTDHSGGKAVEREPPPNTFRRTPPPALTPDGSALIGFGPVARVPGQRKRPERKYDLIRWEFLADKVTRESVPDESVASLLPPYITPSEKLMAYGTRVENAIRVVVADTATGKPVQTIKYQPDQGFGELEDVAILTAGGEYLFTYRGGNFQTLYCWRVKDGERLLKRPLNAAGKVELVVPLPKSERAVTVMIGPKEPSSLGVYLADPGEDLLARLTTVESAVEQMMFLDVSADESLLLYPHNGGVRVCPLPKKQS